MIWNVKGGTGNQVPGVSGARCQTLFLVSKTAPKNQEQGLTPSLPWSSLHALSIDSSGPIRLDPGPAPRGAGWEEDVNAPMFDNDVARVRQSLRRDRPLGDPTWTLATARTLGLKTSLRPPGRRPRCPVE
jgi:hypothetical protein